MESKAYKFSKTLFLYLFFHLHSMNILNLKNQSQEYFEHYMMSVRKGAKIRLGEGVQVADRRRWQWKS